MQDNVSIRIFTITLFIFSGLLIGVLIGPSIKDTGIKIILGAGAFLIAASIYSAVRIYLTNQRKMLKASEDIKGNSEVGFVVDTFQELVGKLKEKEKELERLKALAEDKALRIEAYNENILQSVPSGVVSLDNSLKVKSINQAAEKILGIKAEDAIDMEHRSIFNEPLAGAITGSEPVSRGEYPYATKDGRHIYLGVTTSQLLDTSGGVIGLILIFTDITEVKTLQTQIQLRERLTEIGEMSAGIAHELRNPMSVISGYAQLLSKKIDDNNKGIVNAILKEIEGMDRIISELLSFAKPSDINKTTVNVNKLIEETALSLISGNSPVSVNVNADIILNIKADEVLLRQAFTNLFLNAVEAMPEGGMIEVGLSADYGMARIKIRDTGHGIPEDISHKIFLPFYTTKEKGTGLGLALVQKIIVSHGGSIEVEGAEDEGTIFTITLPAG
ncbi:MAG: PAS domain S-box protein [Nitrospirae bacterium]|nr:PAS domain S-box protein [Nitrospirota bacterium]